MQEAPHLLLLLLALLLSSSILTEALQKVNNEVLQGRHSKMEVDFWSVSPANLPHSRKKRYLAIPVGSTIEVKWSMNYPFNTFTLYEAAVGLAIPIKIPIPDSLVLEEENIFRRDLSRFEGQNRASLQALRKREDRREKTYIYKYFENAFHKAGLAGRSCVLRAICEVAEAPFDQGLLGEMVNTMFTPSLAGRPSKEEEEEEEAAEGHTYLSYLEAEVQGKVAGRCGDRYATCQVSPFDLVPNALHMVA